MSDKYWKKSSRIWPVLTVAGYLAALIISLLIPAAQSKVNQTPYRVVLITLTAVFLLRYIFGFFFEKLRIKVNHQAQIYFVLALLLISWDLLTTKTNTLLLPFFPGPAQILAVMVDDYKTLLISTFYSMRLLVIGFILGTIIGLTSGVLMGWFRQWSYWLFPALKILGVIPATAWIPIAMICF